MGQCCSRLPRKLLLLGTDVRQGGRASWPDCLSVHACHLGRERLVDIGDALFVAALIQVIQRGKVGQVGQEFFKESQLDDSGIAVGEGGGGRGELSCQMVWSLIFVGA